MVTAAKQKALDDLGWILIMPDFFLHRPAEKGELM